MPGTTPNNGFPYPTDTDPIDVAGDMQQLATSIDSLFGVDPVQGGSAAYDDLTHRLKNMTTWYHEQLSGQSWPDRLLVQGGMTGFSTDASSNARLIYPIPFSFKPVVALTPADGLINAFLRIFSIGAVDCVFGVNRGDQSGHPGNWVSVSWLAIGIQAYIP
jgi:hypothetical protein